ncbi:MAG TPA: SMP-30/gluconolactonase/LRE family protein, partial [Terriglobia bacterium]|nr:SMP-30/gluconolactonase/LRE family protein [Terriglobia bacterium]
KQWNLSKNPDDRAIAGLSSGGICAFNAAWNRPDAFHRVLSFIGSFADLRGGDIYPALIRKTEPKPLRVFLQDGSNDLNLFAGDWWLANQTMASALKWAGYDVKFVTGDKDHDMIQGGAILPDALRWLWRDYPAPVAKPAPNGTGERSIPILDPKSEWEAVAPTLKVNSGIAADRKGDIYFADGQDHRIVSVDGNGTISDFRHVVDELAGMRFGPDGTLYACVPASKSIQTFSASKPQEHSFTIATACRDVAVHDKDEIFFTRTDGWVGYSRPRLTIEELAHIFGKPSGILMSPDNSTLFVSNETKRWIWTFQPQADGSLSGGEPFYRLEVSEDTSEIGGYGMSVDTEGYLYVATKLGIQVCDQPGRVVAIINPPADGPLLGVTFGGKDFDYLYVDQGDKLYRRHMLRKGVPPGTVLKPPTPRL